MSDERQRDIGRDTPRSGDNRSGDAPDESPDFEGHRDIGRDVGRDTDRSGDQRSGDETPDFEGHRDIGRDVGRDTDRAGDGTDISRDVDQRNID